MDSLGGSETSGPTRNLPDDQPGWNTTARVVGLLAIWCDGAMVPSSSPEGSFAADATLAEAGEFGLIAALTGRFGQGDHVYVGPGDDAAVLRTPKGHVVVSTDLLVEGRHFRREWAAARDIGRKAAAANLSDVNAMGGTAHSLTVGLAAPADLPVAVGPRPGRRDRRGGRAGRREHRRGRPDHGERGRRRRSP